MSSMTTAGLFSAAVILFAAAVQSAAVKVKSPDGKVMVTVTDTGGLSYSVVFDKREVVSTSRFGIISDGVDLGEGVKLGKTASRKLRETYAMFGAHAKAENHCRETTVSVSSPGGEAYDLDVRAYNDGVALRARLNARPGRKINRETTEWKIPGNPMAWYQTDSFNYEGIFQGRLLGSFRTNEHIALPVTFTLPGGGYALISEANLLNYSDADVQVAPDHSLRLRFHAPPNRDGWMTDAAVVQPWRVTLLARDLNALANSDLIRNLCPSASTELVNADWIKPGRSAWQWWSIGDPLFQDQRQWVDWTRDLGFEYYLVDENWKNWKDNGRDNWGCLKEVCDYAKTRGVKIWIWVHCNDVSNPTTRSNFLDRAVALGVAGVKIDFQPQADVRWVNWYDETLRDAAARKLMVNFHGANKPVGRDRTWPNEMTRESIRGHEWHIIRYRRTLPPAHDTILPFTRYVIGAGDYTPTVFNPKELRGYTWARELAQAIVFTSPFLCYADHPTNYLANPALDVLKSIPATWDETIVLPGSEIGKCTAFARRKGTQWFIGVINGGEGRTLDIALDFLGRGKFQMVQLVDVADRNDEWQRTEKPVTRRERLKLSLRPGGGFVGQLAPLK
ncbi:MAG TPA: glycoside hydrolase family 97 catalytic domain-containing protein [Verrucomicrobiae bacterium]|nr:glycoside hydrolase family 97 catalytic domain-containing protein [Verrucomicrobiae bacterium]